MSLVNDMLRDLEKRERRQGQASDAVAVMGDEPPKTRWVPLIILGVIVAVASYLLEMPKPETRSTIAPLTIEIPQAQTEASAPETEKATTVNQEAALNNRVLSMEWYEAPTQERLLLSFDNQPQLIVESESDRMLKLRFEDTLMGAAIPVLESELIVGLVTYSDGEDTQLEVTTSLPAEFSVSLNNTAFKLEIGVRAQSEPTANDTESLVTPEETPTPARNKVTQPPIDETRPASTREIASTPEVSEARLELSDDRQSVARARELIQRQQPEAAVELLRAFIAESQTAPQSRFLFAQLLVATRQLQAASEAARQGFLQSEGSPEWRSLYGHILIQMNRLEEAASVLSGGTLDREGRELLAYVEQTRGNHARAVDLYLELLKEQSDQARWWIGLAISLEQGGDLQQARSAYENVLRLPNLESNLSRFAVEQLERLSALGGQ